MCPPAAGVTVAASRPHAASMAAGGVSVVDSEMVVFEWLGAAGTPAFKELSRLIR